jgi:hypothetical protein
MQRPTTTSSRKKFLWWGAAALAAISALKIFNRTKKKEADTVKMLTQDGRLVEIDKTLLAAGKEISDKELQQWIKK